MKFTVENWPVFGHLYDSREDTAEVIRMRIDWVMSEWMHIQSLIVSAKTEEDLRDDFGNYTAVHFAVGFGAHHMWVHQKGFEGQKQKLYPERLIIAEF